MGKGDVKHPETDDRVKHKDKYENRKDSNKNSSKNR